MKILILFSILVCHWAEARGIEKALRLYDKVQSCELVLNADSGEIALNQFDQPHVQLISGRLRDPSQPLIFARAGLDGFSVLGPGQPTIAINYLYYVGRGTRMVQGEILKALIDEAVTYALMETFGDGYVDKIATGRLRVAHVMPTHARVRIGDQMEGVYAGGFQIDPAHVSRDQFQAVLKAMLRQETHIEKLLNQIGLTRVKKQ